jgi:membrane-bound lytic murein transglycosylase B
MMMTGRGQKLPKKHAGWLGRSGALLCGALGCLAFIFATVTPVKADAKFRAWVEGFWPQAKAAGISRQTYDRAFAGITGPEPKVIEAANYQPEYKRPIWEYIDRLVSKKRMENGWEMLRQHQVLLDAIEAKYGVDRHIVVAIWGIESSYGERQGDYNVIQALATLAYHNNRAKFARSQLIGALKILQRGDITPERMMGSWAGAMGHTQFIPTTYNAYAVDFTGDGKRDIWGTLPDALGSTANYLRVSKWRPGETWGYEVALPSGMRPGSQNEKTARTLAEWEKLGVRRVGGQPFPRPGDRATLWTPAGAKGGPSFLLLNNFRSILRYNNANSYALAVGHLADRLRGLPPFQRPWPTDEFHLALEQRLELQRHLAARGLLEDEPDGDIGPRTMEALRAYQRARGLPPDGFPSMKLLEMMRNES